jgi:hypothetical protein
MAAKIIKYFLGILNDRTFLSSIEYLDFKNRYISIRRDFFNICFTIANSNSKILRPRSFGLILKQLFVARFAQVSSTNLKLFFDNKISNSFIDYLNVARHYSALLRDDKIDFHKFFRNYLNKRNFKFYEKKGYKYYIYLKYPASVKQNSDQNISNSQVSHNQQDIIDNNDNIKNQTIENYKSIIEQDNQQESDDHLSDSDFESTTSQEMRDFLAEEHENNQILNSFSLTPNQNNIETDLDPDFNPYQGAAPPPPDESFEELSSRITYLTNENNRLENTTPVFSGDSNQWTQFYDRLESTVSSNQEIINNTILRLPDTQIDYDG